MEIKVAREIGYCYGVRDAVDLAIEESKKSDGDPVFTFGPIIHNRQTIDTLENKHNVHVAESVNQIPQGSTVVIRTHGATPDKIEELKDDGFNVVDATCPFVLKTHRKAKEYVDNGYFLVILGHKSHPEVVGIAGHAGGKCAIVDKKEDLESVPRCLKMAVVFQSTVTLEDYQWALPQLATKAYELILLKTICGVTITRQKRVEDVAQEVEVMIIIGGKNSSNTKKLVDVANRYVKKTYHIEQPEEVDTLDFTGVNSVGIGTGTSTPDFLVDEVIERLHRLASVAV